MELWLRVFNHQVGQAAPESALKNQWKSGFQDVAFSPGQHH